MLAIGWKNAQIQFYFNTPERPVNNGRISEIKGGVRGQHVAIATLYELEEFIDHHVITLDRLGDDEPETPKQVSGATHFLVNEDNKLDVRLDPFSVEVSDDPELNKIYIELRVTAHEFFGMGHNTLGEITPKVEAFASALPEDSSETTINQIWMRGNKLRMLLGAHDLVAHNLEMHPAKLDVACAEALRSVVQAFNVFAANSPKATELDQLRLGPDDRKSIEEVFSDIEAVVKDADAVSTEDALNVLIEEVENARTADASTTGDRLVSFAGRSIANFLTTTIVTAYRVIRKGIGSAVSATWTKIKEGAVYTAFGAASVSDAPHIAPLIEFLKSNYIVMNAFLVKVQANPAILQFLEFIMESLGLA